MSWRSRQQETGGTGRPDQSAHRGQPCSEANRWWADGIAHGGHIAVHQRQASRRMTVRSDGVVNAEMRRRTDILGNDHLLQPSDRYGRLNRISIADA
jgi:hypothetical protein